MQVQVVHHFLKSLNRDSMCWLGERCHHRNDVKGGLADAKQQEHFTEWIDFENQSWPNSWYNLPHSHMEVQSVIALLFTRQVKAMLWIIGISAATMVWQALRNYTLTARKNSLFRLTDWLVVSDVHLCFVFQLGRFRRERRRRWEDAVMDLIRHFTTPESVHVLVSACFVCFQQWLMGSRPWVGWGGGCRCWGCCTYDVKSRN